MSVVMVSAAAAARHQQLGQVLFVCLPTNDRFLSYMTSFRLSVVNARIGLHSPVMDRNIYLGRSHCGPSSESQEPSEVLLLLYYVYFLHDVQLNVRIHWTLRQLREVSSVVI